MYWDQRGELHDEPFMTAVRVAVNHGERFPTVAQLREHYRDAIRRDARSTLRLPPRRAVDRQQVKRRIAALRRRLR